jgi:hypothetical protein
MQAHECGVERRGIRRGPCRSGAGWLCGSVLVGMVPSLRSVRQIIGLDMIGQGSGLHHDA